MADELVEFLRARLDEDEKTARAAIADDGGQDGGFEDADFLTDGRMLPRFGEAAAKMVRTFAVPARVLRENESKRRIIGEYERYRAERRRAMNGWDISEPSPIILALAAVYADHPDYRKEWNPASLRGQL